MKTKILSIALAALTIGLLGSCSKINERIDSLEERIDGIGNGSIASFEQQIAAISQSINDLKAADETIGGKIADLKTSAEAQQTLIDALKEADRVLGQKDDALEARIATLEGQAAAINGRIKTLEDADKAINTRIDELKTYIDEGIGKTKDWASATFATLEQHQQTAADLATLSVTVSSISTTLAEVQTSITGLDTKIDGIDAALQGKIADAKTELEGKIADLKTELEGKMAEAISTSETTLKGWVNEQLSAYCTTARMEAEIADLQSEIDALKDSKADKAKIEELETSLDKLSADLSQAKADIKSAYEKAIKDAIEGNDGYITETIKNAIDDANTNITALTGRVETLESAVAALSGDVDALKAMIQTVSVIPAYNDGSLKAEGGILTINCVITPKDAVDGLTKDNFTVLTSEVLTRSGLYGTIAIANDEDLVLDTDNGTATIRVDVSAVLPAEADKALTVALNVKNGISDYTTDFVPVYAAAAPGPVLPEGALTGRFSVSASKQVQFSKGNLVATVDASGAPTAWKFAANQYDCLGGGGANEAIGTAAGDIDLFGWSTATTTYGISTSTNNADYSGSFVDWGKTIGNGSTWRTLSKDEWVYLFETRTNASDLYEIGVTVCGKDNCVIIAPDNWDTSANPLQTSYDATAWATAEAAGLVCLPAAGYRNGSDLHDVGDSGSYWSSAASGSNSAYFVIFYSSLISSDYYDSRFYGSSVRLITDVEGASPVEPEPVKEDPLSGKFSVSASKQIQFSKGNLVATIDASGAPTAWKFAANQYDYLGEGGANKTIGTAAGDVDIFGWSTAVTKYGISTSTDDADYSGDFVDWGKNIGDGSTWRTLSKDEWVYLIETRTNASSLYKKGVTVCGKDNCVIIAPDNWDTSANPLQTSYDATAWATAETAGLVCLPAAGSRSGSDVSYVGVYGYSWSSTAYDGDSAYYVGFNSDYVYPGYYDGRNYGSSVRLITECK